MPVVELPDGTEIDFPEGMDSNQITAIINSHSRPGRILESIFNPSVLEPFKDTIGNIVADVLPGSSQIRSAGRIEDSLGQINSERSPISNALDSADIVLEAGSMAADLIPGLKAGMLGVGAVVPAIAKRQGFLDDLLFHGGPKGIKEFDLNLGGATSGSPVGKLGVSASFDKETAKEFADRVPNSGGEIRTLVGRAEKPATIDLDGSELNNEIFATVQDAWDQGFDAIKFNNYTTPAGKAGKSFVLVKEPNQLRDIKAKFDVDERQSSKLLASGVVGAIGLSQLPLGESNVQ